MKQLFPILMIWNQLKLHQVVPFLPRFATFSTRCRFLKEKAEGQRGTFRNCQPRGPQRGPDDDIPGGTREISVGNMGRACILDLDRICVYVSANSDDNSEKYSHYFI